ncbi:MAG: hypothetical protein ACRYFX_29225 [Janthinobacterium lividum]
MANLTRPALSECLLVGPAGLLRLTPHLGTCYPVDGLRTYGKAHHLENIHFRTDPVALAAQAQEPEPEPAPDLATEAEAAEAGMGWLLAACTFLFSLTAFLNAYYHG